MIKLVLENNNFELNGQHYMQVDSTVTGSRLGKNYAYSYMRKWEEQLLVFPQKPYLCEQKERKAYWNLKAMQMQYILE